MSTADTRDSRITRMSVLKSAIETAAATGTIAGVGLSAVKAEILALAGEFEAWVNSAKSNDAPAPVGTVERKDPPKATVEDGDDGKTVVGVVASARRDGAAIKVADTWYKVSDKTRNSVSGNLWRQRVRVSYAVGTHGRIATAIDPA